MTIGCEVKNRPLEAFGLPKRSSMFDVFSRILRFTWELDKARRCQIVKEFLERCQSSDIETYADLLSGPAKTC